MQRVGSEEYSVERGKEKVEVSPRVVADYLREVGGGRGGAKVNDGRRGERKGSDQLRLLLRSPETHPWYHREDGGCTYNEEVP